jgi:hypothetical protein
MRRLWTIVAMLVALAAAGCGGSSSAASREAYQKDLGSVTGTLQKAFADIAGQSAGSGSAQQVGDRLERGANALDDAANRFAAIKPPSEVKDAHDKLVAGLRELARTIRASAAAARRNDTQRLTKALQGLANNPGVKKITEASQELKADGITVPSAG